MKNLLLIILSLFSVAGFTQNLTSIEKSIFDEMNSHRNNIGMFKYVYNNPMSASCREHSYFMGKNNDLEHVESLDSVKASGEIIQMTYIDGMTDIEIGKEVIKNFLSSPPHKELVESYFNKCSVGIFIDNNKVIWVTIRFF